MRPFATIFCLLLVSAPLCAQTPKPKVPAKNPLTEFLIDRLRNHDIQGVKVALKRGANPNRPDYRGESPLFEAANRGLGMVQMLIAAGANPRIQDSYGNTLLHEAVADPQMVAFLLKHGFNPNARTKDESTPLMLAAEAGSLESASLLLNAGANAQAVAADGLDALMRAIPTNNVALVRLLGMNGASFKGIEDFAVLSAAGMHATKMIRYLASRKFSFKVVDDEGKSPLITCIMSNDVMEQGEDADAAVVPSVQALLAGGSRTGSR
jgi:hypothetical protein